MFNPRKSHIVLLLSTLLLFGIISSMTAMDASADNLKIEDIRRAIKAKKAKWTAGENKITRMPLQARRNLLGLLPEPESNLFQYGVDHIDEYTYQRSLPVTLDWRNRNGRNFITSVKNQKCGDCWAHSAAGALEARLAIGGQPGLDLSEQLLVSNCFEDGSCSGGPIVSTSQFLTNVGLPRENCYPYRGSDSSCSQACGNWQGQTFKATRYARVDRTVAALKTALFHRGPINAGYIVFEDFPSYKSGIYEYSYKGNRLGGHGIVIVGYDDRQQCFIVKNSWSSGWGENGYFRIAYNQVNDDNVMFGMSACVYGEDIEHQQVNELTNGQTVRNLAGSAGIWIHYRISVPANAGNLVIAANGGSGNVDLYARLGTEPTRTNFDCRSNQSGNNESCTFNNPSPGDYYIGLFGYQAFSGVNLTATYAQPPVQPKGFRVVR